MKKGTGLPSQIIGSFEDIGSSITRESIKVPSDIAGKALESLGVSSGKTNTSTQGTARTSGGADKRDSGVSDAWGNFDTVGLEAKEQIARAALAALTKRPIAKDPGVRERIERDDEGKKMAALENEKVKKRSALPSTGAKRARRDLYGLAAKQGSAEKSRNVRQD